MTSARRRRRGPRLARAKVLNPRKGIALFTDGSCFYKDRIGGWAFCAIDCFGGEEVGTGAVHDTTSARMEMQAWVEGLNWVFEELGACDVLVYSDSEFVVLGVEDPLRSRKANADLWFDLDAAIEQHSYVEPIWVKGHHESHYNRLVDELAGNARKAARE